MNEPTQSDSDEPKPTKPTVLPPPPLPPLSSLFGMFEGDPIDIAAGWEPRRHDGLPTPREVKLQKQLTAAREVISDLHQEIIAERHRYRWAHFADGMFVSAVIYPVWIIFVAWCKS